MWFPSFPANDVAAAVAVIAPGRLLAVAAAPDYNPVIIGKVLYWILVAFAIGTGVLRRSSFRLSWLSVPIVLGLLIYGLSPMWKKGSSRGAQQAFTPDQMRSVQTVVANYMYAHTSSPSSIQFLDWSGLENNGADWSVIARYKVLQRSGEWLNATVRFTIRGGTVTDAHVLRQI